MGILERQPAPTRDDQPAPARQPAAGEALPRREGADALAQQALGNQGAQRRDGGGSPESQRSPERAEESFLSPAEESPGRAAPAHPRERDGEGAHAGPGSLPPESSDAAGAPASHLVDALERLEDDAPEPSTAGVAAPQLLVEAEAAHPSPEQLTKDAFFERLEVALKGTAEEELAGTGWSAQSCPYIEYWVRYYRARSTHVVERAIHRYAPETLRAATAAEYIALLTERVRRAVGEWVRTGKTSEVPEGIPIQIPGAASGVEAGPPGRVRLKARDGAESPPANPSAVAAELGAGSPLPAGLRSRMEAVFGADFSAVRIHTDSAGAALADRLHARAFAVGRHVAFASGEFRPGTIVGDALLAHELAHVVQQRHADTSAARDPLGDQGSEALLEQDADRAAGGAVAALWTGGGAASFAGRARTALASGLRLQRCNRTPAPASPTVDRITVVDSPTGAIGGYPNIIGNADLNVPGPFNDATTGECRNVHQIHFHLDAGDSARLTPTRIWTATATAAGTTVLTRTNFPDGPPPHEIQRPGTDRLVVADAVGAVTLPAGNYPFIMTSDFVMTVAAGGSDVARIRYQVRIHKTSVTDVPNTENRIVATEKRDLVRNQALP
jgi:hypothetical protein